MSGHYVGLEQPHVLQIHTDGATLLVFWEHEMHEIEDGCVGVMSLFSEQVANLPSASAMRSTLTTKYFVFVSNGDAFG